MRNQTKVFLTALVVTVLCFALAGMIGQHNDGPWGELPEWLGAVGWFGFLIGVVVTVIAGIYALVSAKRTTSAID